MKPGWAYGTCHGCDNHGPIMVVANGLKCEDCIGGMSTRKAPQNPVNCSNCASALEAWKAVHPWGLQAECPSCGWLVKVDDDGLIREIQPPPAILCSSCGDPLERYGIGFACWPCGRRVTA